MRGQSPQPGTASPAQLSPGSAAPTGSVREAHCLLRAQKHSVILFLQVSFFCPTTIFFSPEFPPDAPALAFYSVVLLAQKWISTPVGSALGHHHHQRDASAKILFFGEPKSPQNSKRSETKAPSMPRQAKHQLCNTSGTATPCCKPASKSNTQRHKI